MVIYVIVVTQIININLNKHSKNMFAIISKYVNKEKAKLHIHSINYIKFRKHAEQLGM